MGAVIMQRYSPAWVSYFLYQDLAAAAENSCLGLSRDGILLQNRERGIAQY